jgi:hypothetical protein
MRSWRLSIRILGRRSALTCVAAALAGCGGASNPASPSQARFVPHANRVCADFNARVEVLPPPVGYRQVLSLAERLQALRESELSKLRALTTAQPSGYAAFLSDLTALDTLYATLLDHAKTGLQVPSKSVIEQGGRLAARLAKDETSLGLTDCARNPSNSTHTSSGSGNAPSARPSR